MVGVSLSKSTRSTLYEDNREAHFVLEQAMANHEKFQRVYQENLALIYRYVYSKVGNREETEDLTSQIFIKAIRHIHLEQSDLSVRKWLFQVASTTIADFWRARYCIAASSLEELLDTGWECPAQSDSAGIRVCPVFVQAPYGGHRPMRLMKSVFTLLVSSFLAGKRTTMAARFHRKLTEERAYSGSRESA
jgi:hypothetical protein